MIIHPTISSIQLQDGTIISINDLTSGQVLMRSGNNLITNPLMDVVGGRLDLVSATSLKWSFLTSNQIRLWNGTNWEICSITSEPILANTALDMNGTALAVDKIYDVFAEYSSNSVFNLKCSRWAVHTAGSSARNAAWAGTTPYIIGDRVTSGGNDYTCIVAHTSGTFATDLAAGKWVLNGTSVAGDFAGLCRHDGVLVSHNSDAGKKLRWLGNIYTYSNSGTVNFKDEDQYRYISNFYNTKIGYVSKIHGAGGHSYTTAAWRDYNNDTVSYAYAVSCVSQSVFVSVGGEITGGGTNTAYLLGRINALETPMFSTQNLIAGRVTGLLTMPVGLSSVSVREYGNTGAYFFSCSISGDIYK